MNTTRGLFTRGAFVGERSDVQRDRVEELVRG